MSDKKYKENIAFNYGGSKDGMRFDHARAYEGQYVKGKLLTSRLSIP